ncbi:hypothetical protein Lser_V15G23189 [Lactuca serriola]
MITWKERGSSHHRSSPKYGDSSDRDKQRGTRETRDRDRGKDRSREDRNGKGRDQDRERERERDRGGDRDWERDRVRVKMEHGREPKKEREERDQEKEKEHERPHRSGSRSERHGSERDREKSRDREFKEKDKEKEKEKEKEREIRELHRHRENRVRNKKLAKFGGKDFEGMSEIHKVSKATIRILADAESNLHSHSYLDLVGTVEEVNIAEGLILDNTLKTYSTLAYPVILMPPTIYGDYIIIPVNKRELPPYFISRAASISGDKMDVTEELDGSSSENNGVASNLNHMKRWFLSHVPNPLFDLAGIMCGQFGISFWKFFLATLIGKATTDPMLLEMLIGLDCTSS